MDDAVCSRKLTLINEILEKTDDPLSEPLGAEFEKVSGNDYLNAWKKHVSAIRKGHVYPGISVYVHIPFCMRICNFCCLITEKFPGRSIVESFVSSLLEEIGIWKSILGNIPVSGIHIGGGTPGILSAEQLDTVLGVLLSAFKRNTRFKTGIEFHPGSAGPDKIRIAAEHNIDRISFGVQSFLEDELKRSNRGDQEQEKVFQAVKTARETGISRINIDLLAGLPGQTSESFGKSLEFALNLGPDSLTVNRTIYENTTLNCSGFAIGDQMINEAGAMIDYADKVINKMFPDRQNPGVSGYGAPYILTEQEETGMYYQADMYCPASVLGIGPGALHHIHGTSYSITNGDSGKYIKSLEHGRYPDMNVFRINSRYEASFYAAQNIYYGNLDKSNFREIFRTDLSNAFGNELKFLSDKKLIGLKNNQWMKKAGTEFQFQHLFFFLLLSEEYLEKSVLRIRKKKTVQTDYPHLKEGWIPISVLLDGIPGSIPGDTCCLVDDGSMDDHAFETVFSSGVLSGYKDVVLWSSIKRLRKIKTAELFRNSNLKRIYADISEETGSAEGSSIIPEIEIIPWLDYRGAEISDLLMLFRMLSGRGYSGGIIMASENLSLENAESIIDFNKKNKIKLQVIVKNPEHIYQQYRKIDAGFPPSLFTCRLGFRADACRQDSRNSDGT